MNSISTYSSILGHNPYAEWFLDHLGIRKQEFGRFRDVSLYKENNGLYVVRVITRNAGSRKQFQSNNDKIAKHKLYLRQEVDPTDDTYLHFFFKMPLPMVDELAANNVDLDVAAASGDYWLIDNRNLKKMYEDAAEEEPDKESETVKT